MAESLEETLKKTQQKLAALEAEYQTFAYIVSHDLSAPLRSIEGFAGLIRDKEGEGFDEKTRHYFDRITHSADQGKILLSTLLTFSRLNTITEPFTEVDCNAVLQEVLSALSDKVRQSNAQITVPQLPIIMADKNQILQLFTHLLHNALHYQPQGNAPHITLALTDQPEHWHFTLTDNGIGIRAAQAEKIFQPLRRGVRDKDFAGAGMGLAIAKKIAQRHEGDLWLEEAKNTKDEPIGASAAASHKADPVSPSGASFHFTLSKGLKNDG